MDVAPLINYIRQYVTLSDKDISYLMSKITFRKYLKGQFIIQQGDVCHSQSFVTKGCAKKYFIDNYCQEHVILFLVENWWASDLESFINNKPSIYNVQCLEATEVLQIHQNNIEDVFENVPQMERFFRKIVERAYIAFQKRVIRNFSLSGKEKYLAFKSMYPLIEQRVPQYLVASYLGITKEFLSKIKRQLSQ